MAHDKWKGRLWPDVGGWRSAPTSFPSEAPLDRPYRHSEGTECPPQASFGPPLPHEGGFLGLKLHVLSNCQGRIVDFELTTGNVHDLSPVKGGLLEGVSGVCFADSGYVSARVRQDLRAQALALVSKPTAQMVDESWLFDRIWKEPYRQRQVVEGVFSRLKNLLGLLAHSCRSAASLQARIYASIAAFNLLSKPAS